MNYSKTRFLGRTIWNGAIGIILEIGLALFFIFAGFLVCMLWWSAHR